MLSKYSKLLMLLFTMFTVGSCTYDDIDIHFEDIDSVGERLLNRRDNFDKHRYGLYDKLDEEGLEFQYKDGILENTSQSRNFWHPIIVDEIGTDYLIVITGNQTIESLGFFILPVYADILIIQKSDLSTLQKVHVKGMVNHATIQGDFIYFYALDVSEKPWDIGRVPLK